MDLEATSTFSVGPRPPLWTFPRVRRWLAKVVFHTGGFGLMLLTLLRQARLKWETGEIVRQMDPLGVQSISITNLTALFTGMVLALQTSYPLAQFGGKPSSGRAVVPSPCPALRPKLPPLMIPARH